MAIIQRNGGPRYDQLAAMRAFARVVETGTFTRASALLEMPKPTVTKLIQTLEGHLRVKLLNRTTRRVIVTPDGAAYYERVARILAELDELEGSMTLSQATLRGRLRVDISAALALLIIIPALPDFHARYPEIRIDLGVTDRPVDLIGENVDCVVRGGELKDQSLIARRIGEWRFITCAAPSYLDRHGEPGHPRDIETDHFVVSYFRPESGETYPFSFARDGEQLEVRARYIASFNDGNAYMAAGVVGLGIIQAPTFMAHQHLLSGALRPILTDWTPGVIPLHIVYPPNRHMSNKLRVFVDWIADLFATNEFMRRSPQS